MCWSENDSSKSFISFIEILHAENVKGILETRWSWKKGHVMKWRL